MSDSNGNNTLVVSLIGLATAIAGGVFNQWDKIFPPKPEADPATALVADPPAAGTEAADAASNAVADAVDQAASDPGR